MSFCSNRGTFVKYSRIVSDKEPISSILLAPKKTKLSENTLKDKGFYSRCICKGIMSPLTAKVKCPHYGGQTDFESEAVEDVASFERADSLVGFYSLKEGVYAKGYVYP
jgi:hypothetical protein